MSRQQPGVAPAREKRTCATKVRDSSVFASRTSFCLCRRLWGSCPFPGTVELEGADAGAVGIPVALVGEAVWRLQHRRGAHAPGPTTHRRTTGTLPC
jgi:hypothetical protein